MHGLGMRRARAWDETYKGLGRDMHGLGMRHAWAGDEPRLNLGQSSN